MKHGLDLDIMSVAGKKSLRRRVADAVAPARDSTGRDQDEEDDVTSARVERDVEEEDAPREEAAATTSRSRIRAGISPSLDALGERYQGRGTSRKSLGEARGDIDEREHQQAEWGSMFEVEEESDQDEEGEGEEDSVDLDGSIGGDSEEEEEEPEVIQEEEDEVAKGKAIKSELQIWEKLMEARIQLQKVATRCNQLPQHDSYGAFSEAGDEDQNKASKKAQAALVRLLDDLLELRSQMVQSNRELRKRGAGEEDGEEEDRSVAAVPPPKKMKIKEYEKTLAKSSENLLGYRDSTIQLWNDKTRLASGAVAGGGGGKSFSAFEQHTSTLKQIEFILSDRSRLVARTQTKRSDYRVLGKALPATQDAEGGAGGGGVVDAELDPEIFDDDDFYHLLLKDLIDRKTGGAAGADSGQLGRHWLQMQKLRSQAKKGSVDTRASKGRKTRYDIHAKLVNFMAPLGHMPRWWKDEARNELFSSLFGKGS